ncbi:hypothetical protein [Microbispora hainanensis]|nr:hypothetical protein [Microbispora hainanensis]
MVIGTVVIGTVVTRPALTETAAGAVRAEKLGDPRYREILGESNRLPR